MGDNRDSIDASACHPSGSSKGSLAVSLAGRLHEMAGDGGVPIVGVDAARSFVGVELGVQQAIVGGGSQDGSGDGVDMPVAASEAPFPACFSSHAIEVVSSVGVPLQCLALHFEAEVAKQHGSLIVKDFQRRLVGRQVADYAPGMVGGLEAFDLGREWGAFGREEGKLVV